ncbi:methyl-accepting chemotaxis protein [Deferribacter abyssi]|uniref:methyl-accepting chemotaxis protein n=1 Tax=Deferribacter abyssi TaxID=213806 RepID=UPI003C1398D4
MNKENTIKYLNRVIYIYILFSLFFLLVSSTYFYKYLKNKFDTHIQIESIKLNNMIKSKETENLVILKSIIKNSLKNFKPSENYKIVKLIKNNDDNFIPIQTINEIKTTPVTKKSFIYNDLIIGKPVTAVTGTINKLKINTLYRLDEKTLYVIKQEIDITNNNLIFYPIHQSINDPDQPVEKNKYYTFNNQIIIKNGVSIFNKTFLFVLVIASILSLGLWSIVNYLKNYQSEIDKLYTMLISLQNKKINDIDIKTLPNELRNIFENFANEISKEVQEKNIFKNIIKISTNIVLLKNLKNEIIFASDYVYKYFSVELDRKKELLKNRSFNNFLNIIDNLEDNTEFQFNNSSFLLRKKTTPENNILIIITDVTDFKNKIEFISKKYNKLKSNIEKIEPTIYELTSISNELKSTVLNTSSSLSEQSSALSEISSALDEIRNVVKNLDISLEKMRKLIENIEETSYESTDKLLEFEKVIDKINQSASFISNEIAGLTEKAYSITSFVDSIFDIANQTKILAINIAIEAAKSENESGKFTIIAQEVKQLANKAESTSSDIKKMVNDIITSINKTTMTTEEALKNILHSKDYFEPLKNLIMKNKDSVSKIAVNITDITESFKDHTIGLNDITATTKDISQAITDITKSSEETKDSANIISENIIKLREIMKQVDNE